MKKTLVLIAIFLFALPFQTVANEVSPEQQRETAIQHAMSATVKVQPSLDSSGSGFFIAQNYVLTAFHVVSQASSDIGITKSDGTECKGKRVYHEESIDLALIKVDCTGQPLEIAERASIGQDVFITGCPSSLDFVVTSGILARIFDRSNYHFIVSDIPAEKGSSGSAMINSKGEVVGVAKALQRDANYLVYAIPFDDVKQFLSRTGVM